MKYDSLIMGPVSLDINIDCEGRERRELGGAVVAAGFAAGRCGFHTAVLTKANPDEAEVSARFASSGADIYQLPSRHTCSIQNRYLTPDQDRRICTSLAVCDPFTEADLEAFPIEAAVYHFGGLVCGDLAEELIRSLATRGQTAVDMQGFLRFVTPDHRMEFRDWEQKKTYLPYIRFLKADAAEAQILTGTADRRRAAAMLFGWGAKEILISNSDELLAFDGSRYYICPIRSRNLSGRTGRGDTAFAGYVNMRQHAGVEESLAFATALVSLKMETPGPFMGSMDEVKQYQAEFYADAPLQVACTREKEQ